jgi:hypothetical protein
MPGNALNLKALHVFKKGIKNRSSISSHEGRLFAILKVSNVFEAKENQL